MDKNNGQEEKNIAGPDKGGVVTPLTGEIQGKPLICRDKLGRFVPGICPNPKGGPKGPKTAKQNMDRAIAKFGREHKTTFEEATLTLAWELAEKKGKTALLEKIVDKRMPNMNEIEVSQKPVTIMPSIVRDGKPKEFAIGGPVKALPLEDLKGPDHG
jgi:hypothetical protein